MTRKTRFEKLLEPFQIRQVKLRNRMVKPPQGMCFSDKDGCVNETVKGFYEALARGGVGMITVEATAVDFPLGVGGITRLLINDDKFISGLSELTKVIHKHGSPTFLQISHSGPAMPSGLFGGLQPVAASSLGSDERPMASYNPARELAIAEIEDIVDKFAKAAERAQKAGFDGVEVHAAHSYLLNSFLSRTQNKRQDAYGCQNLESRSRIVVEVIRAIKERVGQDFPVGTRINGEERGVGGVEKGITSEESQEFGRILEGAGADYLSVTAQGYFSITAWGSGAWLTYPEQLFYPKAVDAVKPFVRNVKKPGALIPAAAAIKEVVSIPVIGVGRLGPKLGEWLLEKGKVDLIAMGRRLLADPELPNKVALGRLEDIAPCTACLECVNRIYGNEPVRCRVNAALGKEREYAIKPAEKKKRVMVIGSGPSGMEAARVASLRGHEVDLYEKEHELGGLLPMAALVKGLEIEDLPALVRYLRSQITKLGVKIRFGREVNLVLVEEIKPDVVILATGGIFTPPEIPGIDKSNVVNRLDLHRRARVYLRFLGPRVLNWLTRFYLPLGKRVVILGGLIHGCEVAHFLVKRGRKVTIVETSDQLGAGISDLNRGRLLDWLTKKGVTMLTEVKYEKITDKGLILTTKEGKRQTIEVDTVLIAVPPRPNTALFKTLEGKVPEIYQIGDCKEPNLIIDAIADGSRIGRAI